MTTNMYQRQIKQLYTECIMQIDALQTDSDPSTINEWIDTTIQNIYSVLTFAGEDITITPEKMSELEMLVHEYVNPLELIRMHDIPSTQEEIEQRNKAMEEIHALAKKDKNVFLWKLLTNTLPDFKRAVEGDADYVHIMRDTNHEGVAYVMAHIERLRQTSAPDYVEGSLWPCYDIDNVNEKKECDYKMRTLCMQLIMGFTDEEWLKIVRDGKFPHFELAEEGDADYNALYRSPNVNSRDAYYIAYRHILRTTPFDVYVKNGKEFQTDDDIMLERVTENFRTLTPEHQAMVLEFATKLLYEQEQQTA